MDDFKWAIRWATCFVLLAGLAAIGNMLVIGEVVTDDELKGAAISEVLAVAVAAAGPTLVVLAIALLGWFLAGVAERVVSRLDGLEEA